MVATDRERDRVTASLQGDQEAFESLIREHQHMIHALCYRMTGSLADAEDLAQETFIHGFRHLNEFRADAKLSSWLYRIAVNLSLNWRKRAARQARLHEEFAKEAGSGRGEDCDRGRRVQEALMSLDPKQRAAVILTCYDGLSHAEAARTLGCSETTVSWRVFAAKRKLKRILKTCLNPEVSA